MNTKKLKMEKFAQKKEQFKTTMILNSNKNNENKQMFK
jgi:hypothetical protein